MGKSKGHITYMIELRKKVLRGKSVSPPTTSASPYTPHSMMGSVPWAEGKDKHQQVYCLLRLPWQNATPRGLKQHAFIFLIVLEAGCPSSRCWQGWFLLEASLLGCRWPPSLSVLTHFCPLCKCAHGASSSSYTDISPVGSGPTFMTSFNL